MLVTGLSHSWSQIEQGRTTGDTDDNRFFQRLRHTQRIKTCTTLIRHRIARDVRTLVQIMYDGRITTAWANHRMVYAMSHK